MGYIIHDLEFKVLARSPRADLTALLEWLLGIWKNH